MQSANVQSDRRRQGRTQAVLPVRVRGIDIFGAAYQELAHTLDLTATGARLGSIHRELKVFDTLIVFYRQRRMEFTVLWTKQLAKNEYQVGLQALVQLKEAWGVSFLDASGSPVKTGCATSATA
jgi:hypothetical protein